LNPSKIALTKPKNTVSAFHQMRELLIQSVKKIHKPGSSLIKFSAYALLIFKDCISRKRNMKQLPAESFCARQPQVNGAASQEVGRPDLPSENSGLWG